MTISRFLTWVMMVPIGIWAVWISVTDVGRPAFSGQPALVNHAAYGVDGPAGFDQAQGESR